MFEEDIEDDIRCMSLEPPKSYLIRKHLTADRQSLF